MSVVPLPGPPAIDPNENSPTPPSLSRTTPVSPRKRTFPEQVWAMLACFRSIQLAIVLLSMLALATLAGVLIPQDGLVPVTDIKREFGSNYRLLKAMGLFNVYSSYWFLALEALFFLNLLFGSFQWLKPACLAATQVFFRTPGQIDASQRRLTFQAGASADSITETLAASLRQARYRVHIAPAATSDTQRLLYACKGNFSRLGPAVAHFGILLMLVSSVYGVFFGFKAQQLAVPGQTFAIGDAQMFKPNIDADLWLGSTPSWKVRVDDFRIVYYPPGEAPEGQSVVKQYYADLSVIDADGQARRRETISVNHPLTVDDTVIYQASFNPTGKLFVEIDGKPRALTTNSRFMNRPVSMTELGDGRMLLVFPFFVQQDPNVTQNNAVFFMRDSQGFVGAKPGKMPPNLRLAEGQAGRLNGMDIRYVRPEIATGLQIKKGPEVPWMYLSYLIIVAGTIMCIFSQRRLWLAIAPKAGGAAVHIAYQSNKAHISFMKELARLEIQWRRQHGLIPVSAAQKDEPAETQAHGKQGDTTA